MDTFPPDLGKFVLPGYINADPPGEAQFALSANGSGYASSIQQAGGEVVVDNLGGINMIASSGAFVGVDSFANITLNTSTTTGVILLQTNGAGYDVDINNAGTIAFDVVGAGAITGLQTINGQVYPPPGGGATSITQGGALVACLGNGAINISSIGAGVVADIYNAGTIAFDTAGPAAITNLSTINGSAYPFAVTTVGDIANTYVLTDGTSVTIGGSGGAPAIEVGSDNTVYLGDGASTVNISNLSTINGVAYPALVSNIGDIATGGFVYTTTTGVTMGVSNTALSVSSDNSLIVGSATAPTQIVYASTIQASATGLSIFEPAAGANVKLDTGGRVKFNEGLSTITDGTGIIVGTEGSTLTFPLDPTSAFNVGAIANLSTINGVAYPLAVKQATYYKSVAQNLTSPNTDVTFDSTGAWNNDGGYITHTNGTTDFTVVQTGLYQLEFSTSILANGGTWTATTKAVFIDITRSPTAETAIIGQSAVINSGANYSQQVSATYYLVAGDVINLRINNTILSGTPTAQGLTTTFDLNTFFTWRYIS
jgi:hypothetical protein